MSSFVRVSLAHCSDSFSAPTRIIEIGRLRIVPRDRSKAPVYGVHLNEVVPSTRYGLSSGYFFPRRSHDFLTVHVHRTTFQSAFSLLEYTVRRWTFGVPVVFTLS